MEAHCSYMYKTHQWCVKSHHQGKCNCLRASLCPTKKCIIQPYAPPESQSNKKHHTGNFRVLMNNFMKRSGFAIYPYNNENENHSMHDMFTPTIDNLSEPMPFLIR